MRAGINDPDTIPIVASSDENYAPYLGVMCTSLLVNTSNPERFHIFVIDGGISASTKALIKEEVKKRKSRLTFLEMDKSTYANFPVRRNMTAAAYYRISIPEIFNSTVKKVIYLDCDLIIRDDLVSLWNTSLEGKHIGAVENISGSTYKKSGIQQELYFNSGVMLIDVEKWRKDNTAESVRKFKIEHPEKIATNDQCALNGVLWNSWKRLPLRWNHQSGLYRATQQLEHFSAEEIEEAIWNPAVIHYIGWSKPWNYLCFHPLVGEYYRYLDQTAWKGTQPTGKGVSQWLQKKIRPHLIKKRLRQKAWQNKYKSRGVKLYQH